MTMFKNFLRDVYKPMQLQAQARGMKPGDVDISGAFNDYIGRKSMERVGAENRKARFGLARERLDLAKDQFSKEKKVAPWATGLSVGNLALQGIQGLQERDALNLRRKKFDAFLENYGSGLRR